MRQYKQAVSQAIAFSIGFMKESSTAGETLLRDRSIVGLCRKC